MPARVATELRKSLAHGLEALWGLLTDPLLIRHGKKAQRAIAENERQSRTCPNCGRTYDDVFDTLACVTAHVATAADMYAEANELIRAVEERPGAFPEIITRLGGMTGRFATALDCADISFLPDGIPTSCRCRPSSEPPAPAAST